jgi:hypothetical protein
MPETFGTGTRALPEIYLPCLNYCFGSLMLRMQGYLLRSVGLILRCLQRIYFKKKLKIPRLSEAKGEPKRDSLLRGFLF